LSVWDDEQVRLFLNTAKSNRTYIAFLLALSTGMRQGEVLGLSWSDVNWSSSTIAVRQAYTKSFKGHALQETKTASSIRTVALPSQVLEALRQHRLKQAEERLAIGEKYNDQGLVVQSQVGTPIGPRNLLRTWYSLLKKSKLSPIRFHDLRHTHATLLLLQGVHPKIVSERLGHSSIQITLDTYSHLLPNMQAAAAESFGELLNQPERTAK
jgi:integrase